MLKTPIAAAALAFATLAYAPEAKAQNWTQTLPWAGIWVEGSGRGPIDFPIPTYGSWAYSSGYAIPAYSYYASYPFQARGYVGYGTNDYPFYGRPYGHPYDPWTWRYMSEDPYVGLARYYYPPLQ